jgi:hypothetical protein
MSIQIGHARSSSERSPRDRNGILIPIMKIFYFSNTFAKGRAFIAFSSRVQPARRLRFHMSRWQLFPVRVKSPEPLFTK